MTRVHDFVQSLQECNRREILASAKFVGDPFAFAPRIIEVQHGRHGIHAQTVDVILVDPEECIGDQEILDFVAAVVEDQGAPVRMTALARVGMLVQMRAVELGQAVRVTREVRGSPIQNHADACLVKPVHEIHEVFRSAEPAGGRKISQSLISPGTVEGMFHHRHQFHMRVAHLLHVGNELVGEFRVREPPSPFLDDAPP